MADTLSTISTVCYIAAGIFFVCAAFFWFYFKIPTAIVYLAGKRVSSPRSGAQQQSGSQRRVNVIKKKNFIGKTKEDDYVKQQTEIMLMSEMKTQPISETATQQISQMGTQQLSQKETQQISQAETQSQSLTDTEQMKQTDLLTANRGMEVLNDHVTNLLAKQKGNMELTMIEEIIIVHTNETITMKENA